MSEKTEAYLLELEAREVDIVLAALRFYQEHGCPMMMHLTHAASTDEIDELCDHINTEDLFEE